MVRKIRKLFSSSGDQQEQPFVQVNADHSIWISKQRLATSSTGWRLMLMTFEARIRQIDWLVSGCNVQCQGPGDTDRGRLQRIPTSPNGMPATRLVGAARPSISSN
jgi:hypothetical protein